MPRIQKDRSTKHERKDAQLRSEVEEIISLTLLDSADGRLSVRMLDREMGSVWFNGSMANALREEAPSAYKPITTVMAAQRDLTRITRRLRPVLAYKGA